MNLTPQSLNLKKVYGHSFGPAHGTGLFRASYNMNPIETFKISISVL